MRSQKATMAVEVGSTDISVDMSVGMSVDLPHQLHNLPFALGSRAVDFEK